MKRLFATIAVSLLLWSVAVTPVEAKDAYARKTGKGCIERNRRFDTISEAAEKLLGQGPSKRYPALPGSASTEKGSSPQSLHP